jgi:MFS family permease
MSRSPEAASELAVSRPVVPRLLSANFLLTCLTAFFSFTSFYLLLATLPVYIIEIGGTESEVGLIIFAFSTTAVTLRLLVGRAADERGKRFLMIAGALALSVCSGLYAAARSVLSLLALRVVHGVGWATYGTAANALVADIAPPERRGEAMGYYGMFSNLSMAIGPALGVFLMKRIGFGGLFLAAAAVALVAFLLGLPIREPPRVSPPAARAQGAWIERAALFPSAVLTLAAMSYGAIVSFLSIYAQKKGMENPGAFFTVYAVTLLAARGVTGRLSDRLGRAAVIAPGLLLAGVGIGLLAFANSTAAFLVIAVLYGLAFAAMQPALMALVVDRAAPGRRGAAMGMFATAMDLGIGGGSLVWGFVAQQRGYEFMYLAAGAVTLATLVVFWIGSSLPDAKAARA